MKKHLCLILAIVMIIGTLAGCSQIDETSSKLNTNVESATNAATTIIENQPAPTDINYSLERYNLIRRAYWVNGQREKANALVCPVEKPLGYIVLFAGTATVGSFVVDGKISSLSSYLFPAVVDEDYCGRTAGNSAYSESSVFSVEKPGIDGAYGSNANGVFFFTVDGKYLEWTGEYLYSDIPLAVDDPVVQYQEAE